VTTQIQNQAQATIQVTTQTQSLNLIQALMQNILL
jgi:hypothetical protein